MLRVAEILIRLVCETVRWLRLAVRSNRSIKAENLFLRRQLAPDPTPCGAARDCNARPKSAEWSAGEVPTGELASHVHARELRIGGHQ
jgi:hypothetical protein